MTICCGDTIDGLYSATIVTGDNQRYRFEVENASLDPTTVSFEDRPNSRAVSKQRKRSIMSMTLTIVDEVDDRLLGGGDTLGIFNNAIFKPILGQCGLNITLVSECGTNTFTMRNATEVSGSQISLSDGTVDVTFTSPREIACRGINRELISNVFDNQVA